MSILCATKLRCIQENTGRKYIRNTCCGFKEATGVNLNIIRKEINEKKSSSLSNVNCLKIKGKL